MFERSARLLFICFAIVALATFMTSVAGLPTTVSGLSAQDGGGDPPPDDRNGKPGDDDDDDGDDDDGDDDDGDSDD